VAVGREIAALGYKVAYWQVPPPTMMVGDESEFTAIGSYEDRLAITRRFNSSLAAAAYAEGHGWLCIFDFLTVVDGCPSLEFFMDGVHLSQQAMHAAREAAKRVFPHLDFSHA
jgi:hypothetical protein